MSKYYQGYYKPKNPDKYLGSKDPYYRSGWEKKAFHYFDNNTNIIAWGSETITIPYFSVLDQKSHRYFPDIYCKVRDRDGNLKEFILEIKPMNQSVKPMQPKNKTAKAMKNYRLKMKTWVLNECKWQSAREYCTKMGYTFRVITEHELYG